MAFWQLEAQSHAAWRYRRHISQNKSHPLIEGYSIMASTLAKSRVFRESPFILDPVTFHLTSSGCPSAVPRNDSSHKTSTVTCPSTQGEPLEKNDWIGIQVILLV